MSTVRARFVEASAVNAPVVAHIKGVKSITLGRAEAILAKFISTTETLTSGMSATDSAAFAVTGMSTTSGKNPVLGQLRRLQRDLRGLPPLLADLEFGAPDKRPAEKPAAQNKRIKFDSDDEAAADLPAYEAEELDVDKGEGKEEQGEEKSPEDAPAESSFAAAEEEKEEQEQGEMVETETKEKNEN
ncbi:hypothetical protein METBISCDRAFT_26921 [Metschnikowia bicuspidata]|uniref:Uncharacterized protein n=1 Tax=Metschnikowia bicuspidata TaxID=27322 RepID=A0A4P9ZEW5_9ASCO|nr:hypothetical protein METBISCDRAFT_26921 [Metschnikowia bicuspidata]